ncbi:MAG TPA: HAMP domain-containing sensor histidine kinase [Patescibacteria group bacterium]
MFGRARFRLTAWYLLIIMGISILFSVAFYNVTTREVQRVVVRVRTELHDPFDVTQIPPQIATQRIQDLQESQQRLLFALIVLNGIIFLVAGGGGYFLAGRTLKPIQQMVDEQNRFITDASHELRTPLTSTRTAMEVALRDKDLNLKDAKDVIKSSLEDVKSMQSLSDNLLILSQFEGQELGNLFEKVLIASAIASAIKKVEFLAKEKQIKIIKKTNSFAVKGNFQNLEELFVIFLDNAIKYSPKKSSVYISAGRTDGHVAITISDEGIGIAKENIYSIFNRFYREEKSRTKNKASGYGLGLSIAKKIVEEHKGSIKVDSKVGRGTTFKIILPIMN